MRSHLARQVALILQHCILEMLSGAFFPYTRKTAPHILLFAQVLAFWLS
jgi:hypothetical protein